MDRLNGRENDPATTADKPAKRIRFELVIFTFLSFD